LSEKDTTSFEKRVKEAIEKTGLPTEIKATNYLKQNRWLVINEFPYIDVERNKLRTLDIKAELSVYKNSASTEKILECELYIECKKSEKPWVFYVEDTPWSKLDLDIELLAEKVTTGMYNAVMDAYVQSGQIKNSKELKKPVSIFSKIPNRFENIKSKIALSHQIAFVRVEEGEDTKDEIYSAEMQILKALNHQDNRDKLSSLAQSERKIVIPIILLNGNMFGCYYENNELQTPKINYTRHLAHGLPNQQIPALIDVVTLDYFPQYLKLIESELRLISEKEVV
jgi:hypothetical protein